MPDNIFWERKETLKAIKRISRNITEHLKNYETIKKIINEIIKLIEKDKINEKEIEEANKKIKELKMTIENKFEKEVIPDNVGKTVSNSHKPGRLKKAAVYLMTLFQIGTYAAPAMAGNVGTDGQGGIYVRSGHAGVQVNSPNNENNPVAFGGMAGVSKEGKAVTTYKTEEEQIREEQENNYQTNNIDVDAYLKKASNNLRVGKLISARQIYLNVVSHKEKEIKNNKEPPRSLLDAYLGIAETFSQEHKYNEALVYYRIAKKLFPKEPYLQGFIKHYEKLVK